MSCQNRLTISSRFEQIIIVSTYRCLQTFNQTFECLEIPIYNVPTYFREYYNIFHITLWTSHFGSTISFLLFIYPSLQAILMNPFCCAFAHTGLNPTSFCIIFISGKAHPTSFPTSEEITKYYILK